MNLDSDHTSNGHDTDVLAQVMDPIATTMGFELILVEWSGQGGARTLRVYLDRVGSDSGVSLVDCAQMSRLFSQGIDSAEIEAEIPNLPTMLSQPYTLEVSSPGLNRPLVSLAHFQRFVGKRVSIRTWHPVGKDTNQRVFHGIIESTHTENSGVDSSFKQWVSIQELDQQQQVRFELSQIRRAHLVYEGDG